MTAIVMKKDHATILLETVFVREGGMVSMTAHFVSLESMFHLKKKSSINIVACMFVLIF